MQLRFMSAILRNIFCLQPRSLYIYYRALYVVLLFNLVIKLDLQKKIIMIIIHFKQTGQLFKDVFQHDLLCHLQFDLVKDKHGI